MNVQATKIRKGDNIDARAFGFLGSRSTVKHAERKGSLVWILIGERWIRVLPTDLITVV